LPHESGAIERIGGQLTRSERYFIVHGIPEGSMFREISLIWEIPDGTWCSTKLCLPKFDGLQAIVD
jgi:hypothetical protein